MEPNEMKLDDDDDLEPLPDAPEPMPEPDPFAGSPLEPHGDDDDALRKMGKRTSNFGRISAVLLIGLLGGLGVFVYLQESRSAARWDAYQAAQDEASDPADFQRRMRELLPNTNHPDVRVRIMSKMAHYRDTAAVPIVIPQLEASSARVRAQAARTLAVIGSPHADQAKPHLLRALPNADARDRAPIVWALAVLGESGAADAILAEFTSGHLQAQEHPPFDPAIITNVLGPQRLASNDLLNHDELSVRTLTASALAEAASPEVIDPLSRMVDFELARENPDEGVLRAIASGLGRASDPRAGAPLFRMLGSQPQMRSQVIDSIRRSVGGPGIAALVESATDVGIKRELARILAASHDPRAADALASLLDSDDEDTQHEATFGLAELGDARAVPALLELARNEDLGLGRRALTQLQNLGSAEAAEGLLEMLGDEERFLGRRAGVLRALGTSGASHAGPAIERLLGSDDVASAAAALADLDYDPTYRRLRQMVPRPRDRDFSQPSVANEEAFMNRMAAVRAMGRYGRPDAAEDLMRIIEDPQDDRRLRHEAGFALGALANLEVQQRVLQKIQDRDLDEYARRYYVGALWQRPNRELVGPLLDLIQNAETPPDVRRSASLAVGYAADPAADDRISSLLESPATRREAAFMVVLGGNADQARTLLGMLGEDRELRGVLQDGLMNQDNDWFNLVTHSMFESGQIFRRIEVARILHEGDGDNRQSYSWTQLINRLRAGWGGHDGMTPRQIRDRLWRALRGDDPARRRLMATLLGAMNERGLLMSARDQGGDGSDEARAVLRRMDTAAES